MSAVDTYAALCRAAKLHVLSAEQVGGQVCVEVAAFSVTPETVLRRLTKLGASGVTFSLGDGTGNVELRFMAEAE